jgi:hypothetical protein
MIAQENPEAQSLAGRTPMHIVSTASGTIGNCQIHERSFPLWRIG